MVILEEPVFLAVILPAALEVLLLPISMVRSIPWAFTRVKEAVSSAWDSDDSSMVRVPSWEPASVIFKRACSSEEVISAKHSSVPR